MSKKTDREEAARENAESQDPRKGPGPDEPGFDAAVEARVNALEDQVLKLSEFIRKSWPNAAV